MKHRHFLLADAHNFYAADVPITDIDGEQYGRCPRPPLFMLQVISMYPIESEREYVHIYCHSKLPNRYPVPFSGQQGTPSDVRHYSY